MSIHHLLDEQHALVASGEAIRYLDVEELRESVRLHFLEALESDDVPRTEFYSEGDEVVIVSTWVREKLTHIRLDWEDDYFLERQAG